jgi:hypothetical protein
VPVQTTHRFGNVRFERTTSSCAAESRSRLQELRERRVVWSDERLKQMAHGTESAPFVAGQNPERLRPLGDGSLALHEMKSQHAVQGFASRSRKSGAISASGPCSGEGCRYEGHEQFCTTDESCMLRTAVD